MQEQKIGFVLERQKGRLLATSKENFYKDFAHKLKEDTNEQKGEQKLLKTFKELYPYSRLPEIDCASPKSQAYIQLPLPSESMLQVSKMHSPAQHSSQQSFSHQVNSLQVKSQDTTNFNSLLTQSEYKRVSPGNSPKYMLDRFVKYTDRQAERPQYKSLEVSAFQDRAQPGGPAEGTGRHGVQATLAAVIPKISMLDQRRRKEKNRALPKLAHFDNGLMQKLDSKLRKLNKFTVDFDNPLINLAELDSVAFFQQQKARKDLSQFKSQDFEVGKCLPKDKDIGIDRTRLGRQATEKSLSILAVKRMPSDSLDDDWKALCINYLNFKSGRGDRSDI